MNGFDQSTETQRPPWKIVALIAGAAVLAVALIIGAVLFVRSRQKVEIATQNMDRVETQLAASLVGCAEQPDPEECRRKKVLLAAKATGAASVCGQLEGKDRDSCIWTIARERNDADSCALIEDATKAEKCASAIYLKLALAGMDKSYCDKITDAEKQTNCASAVDGPLTSANCAERGKDQETCDDLAAYEAAVASDDQAACAALTIEADREMCAELVGPPDRDEPAPVEPAIVEPDPNLDSDGDGYTDLIEIQGGYNPYGPGTLSQ